MSSCTFFEHRIISENIKPLLHSKITELIEQKNVDIFYVGNEGGFDIMVQDCLNELKRKYPHIQYTVVLAYIDKITKYRNYNFNNENSIFPDILEKTPLKFAISKRNYWMLGKSEYVITYVKNITGGAAKFKEIAERKGKKVYNLV